MNSMKLPSTTMRGAGLDTLIVLILFGALLLLLVAQNMPANVHDVRAVAVQAESNADAKRLVVNSLKTSPTPTVRELAALRAQVNDILVLDASKEITGDRTLHALKLGSEVATSSRSDTVLSDGSLLDSIPIGILATFIALAVPLGILGFRQIRVYTRGE